VECDDGARLTRRTRKHRRDEGAGGGVCGLGVCAEVLAVLGVGPLAAGLEDAVEAARGDDVREGGEPDDAVGVGTVGEEIRR
jgi:hypothetical protein